MKTCTKCGETKPLSEFYARRARCKSCIKIESSAYAKANREKRTATNREWQSKNRDKVRASCNKWNAAHKDVTNGSSRRWRAANPDKVRAGKAKYNAENADRIAASRAKYYAANIDKSKAAYAKWIAANPEARRIINQNRRARKRENGGKLSKGLADKLFTLQRGKCACGCKQALGNDYHLDHIMPLSLGGTNTDNNIQLLRSKCNLQKNSKHPVDFMRQRGYLI